MKLLLTKILPAVCLVAFALALVTPAQARSANTGNIVFTGSAKPVVSNP